MKLKILLDQLEIVSATADPETEILGISYDSRKTCPGDLFVASAEAKQDIAGTFGFEKTVMECGY